MAFTGTAVVKEVSDGLVRVTGLSLDNGGVSGTIGLHEKTIAPEVRLPAAFQPREYTHGNVDVSLQDSVQVWVEFLAPGTIAQPIAIVKTGVDPRDFLITFTNSGDSESPNNSGPLEIYIRFH